MFDFNDKSSKSALNLKESRKFKIRLLIYPFKSRFLGKSKNKTYKVIQDFLDETFPNEEWFAEDSFCASQGYGGKIDLYSKSGIFVDFKTKDNLEGKDADKLASQSGNSTTDKEEIIKKILAKREEKTND